MRNFWVGWIGIKVDAEHDCQLVESLLISNM